MQGHRRMAHRLTLLAGDPLPAKGHIDTRNAQQKEPMAQRSTQPRTGRNGQSASSRSTGGAKPRTKQGSNLKNRLDRCLELAQSAAAAGDKITAEGHYQHAEHYFRTIRTAKI